MTQQSAPGALTDEIARAVADLPGVAFLKPNLAGRLRSALTRPGQASNGAAPAGVRLTRADGGTGPWNIEIQLVAVEKARTVDVARDARRAVDAYLASAHPEQAAEARVTVIVTGLV
ncbi:hypothetical protein [Streptomyces sp. cg35]|uniref:hypothetical protein n=1 Tax=Streptomyces sp. cg35 TaxID=3421650 RepID=UPI003D167A74